MLTDWYGWCLVYVQTAFGTGWAGSNATEAWDNHIPDSAKHQDRDIPGGMYVPIYFSGYHGLGHFGIYKDGYVWCTPIDHKPTADVWDSISTVEQKYGVTYVGWSEMLGGTQVIEYTPDVVAEQTPPQPTYQVTETYPTGKQVQLNKQPTNLWGMNYHLDYMVDHPVEVHNQGEIWTVTNKVHHENDYDYYRRDDQVDGFNVLDCDDYTPPPQPYIPPSAPETAKPAEKYQLVTTLKYYNTLEDIQKDHNAAGTVSPRADGYYVFGAVGIFKNLSTDNQIDQNKWINTLDNKKPIQVILDEKPTTTLPSQVKVGTGNDTKWMGSYKSFHPNRSSDLYEVKQHMTMLDYSGKRNPVALQPGDRINVPGTFIKDGVMFYRSRSSRDEFFSWYYGISLYDDYGNIQVVKVVETTPKITLKNIVYWVADDLRRWWDVKKTKEK